MKQNKALYLSAALYILWGVLCMIVSKEINYIVLFKWAVFIPLLTIAGSLMNKNVIYFSLIAIGMVQSVIVIMQQIGVFASHNPFFPTIGFMGNPGIMGGFQAIAMTACIVYLKKRQTVILTSICIVFIAYSIIASGSRAALIAAVFGSILLYRKPISTFFNIHKWSIAAVTIICIVGAACLYFYRPGSANARLLIWRVSSDIIQDNLIFGIGPGQFRSTYMLYQASYFARNPLSEYSLVADNAAYPYNEFIRITVEQGIIGLSIFLSLVYFAIRRSSDSDALAPLGALLLFSCFSYPIDKPAMAMLFPILLGTCANNYKTTSDKSLLITSSTVLLFSIVCISFFWTNTEKDIKDMRKTYNRKGAEILTHKLPHIYTDIRFNSLYFNLVQKYEEMQDTVLFCFALPSCENWCDIGNFYYRTGNMELAEKYFRQATDMIPTRLLPKYYLWKLLNEQNREDEAVKMAKIIMEQPIKVENTTTLRIRQEVKTSL